MNSLQRIIAKRPTLTASLLACLSIAMLATLTVFILINNAINDASRELRAADSAGLGIIEESISVLLQVDATGIKDCSEAALATLRQIQFRTRHIGDIGIHDEQDNLLCSSMLGKLEQPLPGEGYDVLLQHDNRQFGYAYQRPVLISQNRIETTLIYYDIYNVVIRPESLQEIITGDIALLRYRGPEGGLTTVFENTHVPYGTRQLLYRDEFSSTAENDNTSLRFEPETAAFVVTYKNNGENDYYYISSINLGSLLQEHRQTLLLLLLLYIFVAILIYRLLLNKFTAWSQLGYRIRKLLTPEHIRCYYQPIIDLKTRQITGCEVLMRILDDNHLLFPDSFFPLIIKQKLQAELDQAVTEKARLELEEHPLPAGVSKVGFNFFPETISSGQARQIITDFMKHSSQQFVVNLEVLEQEFHGPLLDEIKQLRALGITISIDDFGTGYSNLSSIKDIAPDFLKIDRAFIRDFDKSTLRASLIPEIINIARAVNAEVVAEGIEKAHQVPLLDELGVEYAQGYYFGKPMPIQELLKTIKRQQV